MDANGEPSENEEEDLRLDISGARLDELLQSDETALAKSLRRILSDLDHPSENFAAFGNTP